MSVSLRAIADLIKKDQRTVRRWCEKKIIPGAYQTSGGHWRVRVGVMPCRYVEKALARARAHSGNLSSELVNASAEYFLDRLNAKLPKQFARNRRKKKQPQMLPPASFPHPALLGIPNPEAIALRFHLAASRSEVISDNSTRQDFLGFLSAGVTPASDSARQAAVTAPRKTALYTAAVELRLEGVAPTRERLAEKMAISRTTLWRDFTRAEIKAAIAAAG